MANAIKIVGIILFLIGLISIISGGIFMYMLGSFWAWYLGAFVVLGVVPFVIGLILLIVHLIISRKKNSKSPDTNL